MRDGAAWIKRAVKEFIGFRRITRQPGEKQRVEFKLTSRELGFYNREMRFVVEPGEFRAMVGPNSEELLESKFEVQNQ